MGLFGGSPEPDPPIIELVGDAMVAVPVALLSEVHDVLKKAGHELAGAVFKYIPAPGAHGDE
jgi:hypothetical protein